MPQIRVKFTRTIVSHGTVAVPDGMTFKQWRRTLTPDDVFDLWHDLGIEETDNVRITPLGPQRGSDAP